MRIAFGRKSKGEILNRIGYKISIDISIEIKIVL